MTDSMRTAITRCLLLTAAVFATGCGARSINEVLADPGRYRDKQVRVAGAVVESYSVAGNGAYQIDDSTGRLWILSKVGVPRRGARVKVTGTVRESFSLGTLGDVLKLPPAIGAGVVLLESSHEAD